MTIRTHLSVALAAALSAAACGDGAPDWAGTLRDSAGIQIVENPASGLWDAGGAWTIDQTLQIGTAEGEAEYQFGQIGGLAVDDAGTIYVLDQQGQHIKVFDAAGQYVRTIGSGGSGPGQLSGQATGLVLGHGDTLLVLDAGNARFNKYLRDGTPAGSFRVDFANGVPLRVEATSEGDLVLQLRRFAFPGAPVTDTLDHVVRMRAASAPEDITVAPERESPVEPRPTVVDTLLSFPQGRTFSAAGGRPQWEFFSPEPTWDLRPDGRVLFAINSEYRIQLLDTTGAVSRILSLPREPTPVAEADEDRMRNSIIELMLRQAPRRPSAEQVAQIRSGMHFAPNYPVFALLTAGPRGSTWVQHVQTPDQLSEDELANFNIQMDLAAPRWDVFDAEGHFLGTLDMPGRIQVLAIQGDDLYGILRDDLDVQYVVRLRVGGMTD